MLEELRRNEGEHANKAILVASEIKEQTKVIIKVHKLDREWQPAEMRRRKQVRGDHYQSVLIIVSIM